MTGHGFDRALPGLAHPVRQHRPALPRAPGRPARAIWAPRPGCKRGVRLVRRHRAHLLGRPAGGADWQPGQALVLARNPQLVRPPGPARPGRAAGHRRPGGAAAGAARGRVQMIAPTGARPGWPASSAGRADVGVFRGAGLAWERLDLNLRTPALRRAGAAAGPVHRDRPGPGARRSVPTCSAAPSRWAATPSCPSQPGYTDVLTGTGQGTGDLEAARRHPDRGRLHRRRLGAGDPDGQPVPAAARGCTPPTRPGRGAPITSPSRPAASG